MVVDRTVTLLTDSDEPVVVDADVPALLEQALRAWIAAVDKDDDGRRFERWGPMTLRWKTVGEDRVLVAYGNDEREGLAVVVASVAHFVCGARPGAMVGHVDGDDENLRRANLHALEPGDYPTRWVYNLGRKHGTAKFVPRALVARNKLGTADAVASAADVGDAVDVTPAGLARYQRELDLAVRERVAVDARCRRLARVVRVVEAALGVGSKTPKRRGRPPGTTRAVLYRREAEPLRRRLAGCTYSAELARRGKWRAALKPGGKEGERAFYVRFGETPTRDAVIHVPDTAEGRERAAAFAEHCLADARAALRDLCVLHGYVDGEPEAEAAKTLEAQGGAVDEARGRADVGDVVPEPDAAAPPVPVEALGMGERARLATCLRANALLARAKAKSLCAGHVPMNVETFEEDASDADGVGGGLHRSSACLERGVEVKGDSAATVPSALASLAAALDDYAVAATEKARALSGEEVDE